MTKTRYVCSKVHGYDRKNCQHKTETGVFRVLYGGYYVRVCKNAYDFAKSRGMHVSKGGTDQENVPFSEKIPAIRLNHRI